MNGIVHMIRSLQNSLAGLKVCFRDELAFRQECLLGAVHFVALTILPLSGCVRFGLAVVWLLLIAVELLNTAIEAVVDLASPEWHHLAAKAKDCASAAVFCVLMLLAASWVHVIVYYT